VTLDKLVIEIRKKYEFGHFRYYPLNDVADSIISIIPRRNTFFKKDLDILETLNFEVKVIGDDTLEG